MGNNVRFENQGEEFGAPRSRGGFDLSGMLIKLGLVSSRKQVESVLIVIALLAFGIAVYVYMSGTGSDVPPPLPPQ